MIPAHKIAPAALAVVLQQGPISPEKVALAWRLAVGTPMAQAGTVGAFNNGVLRVTACNTTWRNEIERSAGIIRRRINDQLGDQVVHEIRVNLP